MLLEGRFFGLRFYLGVRVTGLIDETTDAERAWGWSYQTLQGHLEQGRLSYEVIKNLATGRVLFRVSGYSRMAPIPSPVVRWGFRLFGRWTQQRFYLAVQRRLRRLVVGAQRGAPLPTPGRPGRRPGPGSFRDRPRIRLSALLARGCTRAVAAPGPDPSPSFLHMIFIARSMSAGLDGAAFVPTGQRCPFSPFSGASR